MNVKIEKMAPNNVLCYEPFWLKESEILYPYMSTFLTNYKKQFILNYYII